jgi:hypothetical protein
MSRHDEPMKGARISPFLVWARGGQAPLRVQTFIGLRQSRPRSGPSSSAAASAGSPARNGPMAPSTVAPPRVNRGLPASWPGSTVTSAPREPDQLRASRPPPQSHYLHGCRMPLPWRRLLPPFRQSVRATTCGDRQPMATTEDILRECQAQAAQLVRHAARRPRDQGLPPQDVGTELVSAGQAVDRRGWHAR